MIVGHIGVRKNSKGLKGKNFRPINGKPLLDWSLDQLLRCEALDFVFVYARRKESAASGCL